MSARELSDPRRAGRMVPELHPLISPDMGEGIQSWGILLQRARQIGLVRRAEK